MASKFFPSLVATAFGVLLFNLFLKRKSRGINGGEANNSATASDEIAESSSSAHTSIESHGMVTSSGYDFEVFLSFRRSDIRVTFANYLYTSLKDVGIRTFQDNEEPRVWEEFGPELLQAINQSKVLIPIFSKGYAFSIRCLKELVQMVNCQKSGKQKIMPIFYDVAPTEVRFQTGNYGKAILSHEKNKRYNTETMRQWKDALSAVGALNGWDLHNKLARREDEFAKAVARKVFNELKKASLKVSNCFVSVDNHVNAIMEMIGSETGETRIIGIYGMGGIGKTTIAKSIYNQLSKNFEGCCFLSDVRETSKLKGIQCLQNQLITDILNMEWTYIQNIDEGIRTIKCKLSNKRVLLLLDDVMEWNHMNALVGNHDWFGKGSKIIFTTRNKEVFELPMVDGLYEVCVMDLQQSLQLFSKHAFRRDFPSDEYMDQSIRAIHVAGGLPLILEVIGSLLGRTQKTMWDIILKKLENVPYGKVQSKLKISYDVLDLRQKLIFLDIACLFIGYDKDILVYFWDESGFFPEEAMEVLQNMSLIKINKDNVVWMHDQLRDLGKQIVRVESNMNLAKQSRVWNPEEAMDLLRRYKGNKGVKALRVKLEHHQRYRFTYEGFKSLLDLKFLEVNGSKENFHVEERLLWHESPLNVLPTYENSDLLPRLRWLSWCDFPPTFNITNFSMEDVVILDLSRSKITQDWNGWSHIKVIKNLKVLNLTNCCYLERTPIFSPHAKLERLILRGCTSLAEIDRSICFLKSLVSLDVRNCRNLQSLPEELGRDLVRLESLSLQLCTSLERLPDSIGNLESLIELDISGTRIKELPDSIGNLKNLKKVKMHCDISKIPNALWTIEKLVEIDGRCSPDCRVHVNIGNCIYRNRFLRILRLMSANIYALPRLPESLIKLELSELYMETFPDLSNLTNLTELAMRFPSCDPDGRSYGPMVDPMPRWIENLSKLESLALRFDCETTSPTDLSLPPQLKALRLEGLNLGRLLWLPSSLSSLHLSYCNSLCSMDLSNLKNLSSLVILSCAISEIQEIQGFDCLESLQDLQLNELKWVQILPDLSNLNKLRYLRVDSCDNLVEIQGKLPKYLEDLEINICESLQKLPDLSSLKRLRIVKIFGCGKLNVEAISLLCFEKSIEFVGEDDEWNGEDNELEGEDDNYEYESEGEDDTYEYEPEGEDD